MDLKTQAFRAGLKALELSRAHKLAGRALAGRGVIFMAHHVTPEAREPAAFRPNALLSITPDFLEAVIEKTRALGYDIVAMDAVPGRLADPGSDRLFAAFTLDDGYKDNIEHALPVFERHQVPFTVYVASGVPDRSTELWWIALERAVAENRTLSVPNNALAPHGRIPTETLPQKSAAFATLYAAAKAMSEQEQRCFVRALCTANGTDPMAPTEELGATWEELAHLAAHPLATIGAHTAGHYALARLAEDEARDEISKGVQRIREELRVDPTHFAYPYGWSTAFGPRDIRLADEAGFKTAVTTAKGVLEKRHAHRLHALPRLSLNGHYQDARLVELLLSGVPFKLAGTLSKRLVA